MKKKVIWGLTVFIALALGITLFLFLNNKNDGDEDIKVYFEQEYTSVGEPLKVKVNGVKKKKCEFFWYVNDKCIDDEKSDEYEIREADLEKTVRVKVKYKNQEAFAQLYVSRLPVMNFEIKGDIGEKYEDAVIHMQNSHDLKDTQIYNGKAQIKIRGNSTKWRDKKPYKLELNEKVDLLGLGSSKDWVLLAEDIDHTLVRNRLVMHFADGLGMPYTSNCTSVVVFVNDSYQGVYTLIEQVRIGESQVNITDYKELSEKLARKIVIEDAISNNIIKEAEAQNAESKKELLTKYELIDEADILENQLYQKLTWMSKPYEVKYKGKSYDARDYVDIPDLTGGFLIEGDFYHSKTAYDSLQTAFLQPLYFNSPERAWTNSELKDYALKYIQTFEYALHSEDFTYHENETHYKADSGKFDFKRGWTPKESANIYSDKKRDGMRYDDLFDMDSLLNYFLVCEFTRNWDSMKNSTFIYKDVNEKAYMGPVWDYDWAFGNINMYNINTNFPKGWHTTDIYFSNEQLYQNYNWNRYLIKDKFFVEKLYEKYWEIRPTLIEDMIKEGGLLEEWKAELKEAGLANDKRWKYTYRTYRSYGYEESWKELETFIKTRIQWFDEQFVDADTLYESLNSYDQYEWR